ncbi:MULTISPECIES: hypothetical protein [Paenibacillus]|uniref:hypothetical protein n=1 Tax=Paenibacillus TaxID=44249 RepID=UPI0022B907F1|nr:hypothetical protein [Paenibacillus caseinilyticus]MCZ8520358.1 hypothetical protein [Paenibacillus caseinilyticus]
MAGLTLNGFFMSASIVSVNTYFQKRYSSATISAAYGLSNGISQIGGTFIVPIWAGALISSTVEGMDFTLLFALFITIALVGAASPEERGACQGNVGPPGSGDRRGIRASHIP